MSEGHTPSPLRLRFETVGSIVAIVVGIAALFVSWDQGRVMRAQQHASVLPAIQIDGFVSEDQGRLSTGLRMRNNGVGPALIRDFRMHIGEETFTSWDELSSRAPAYTGRNWSSIVGRVLGPQEEIVAIDLFWDEDRITDREKLLGFLSDISDAMHIEVCYCSAFDRCFTSGFDPSGHQLPQLVPDCTSDSAWSDDVKIAPPSEDLSAQTASAGQ